jgi:molecular chaperone HtpG
MTELLEQDTFSFKAEAVQILDLMIHSLYSNKEIFLRELISNASDAIDRLRLELLCRAELPEEDGPLQIRVSYDKDAGTITIADNGIGMSREDVIEHIGTIAKSGTREFLQTLTGDQRRDTALIGQFGVGFYSSFIVAERVVLTTRHADLPADQGVRWESDGKGEFTLRMIERPARGTTVVLQLRESEDDLLNGYRLRSIIQKYSDHISLPILMPTEETGQGPDALPDTAVKESAVNRSAALWTRSRTDLSDQDYGDFYRHISGDSSKPLAWVHAKAEGTFEYTLLLFVPSKAPYDLWVPSPSKGIKLHVQRVFIMEDSGQLMPRYLRFVHGVIDSSDLPLNVSRELLQSSRAVSHIRSTAVKKVLKLLKGMAENEPEKYACFWREFGSILKEGIADDYANRDEIARLLRFTSTRSDAPEPEVSLSDYVARMKEGQEEIYYLIAPTMSGAAASPHLEAFRDKGVEVLLLSDGVDNWVVSSLREFDGRRLQSVAQGAANLTPLEDEAEREATEQAGSDFAALVSELKEILAGKVWDVKVSSRLTTSPACLVANEPDIDVNIAYRLRGTGIPSQPVLEINPHHPLVERLNRMPRNPDLAAWAHILYNEAVLTLGARVADPASFVMQLNELLTALVVQDGS